MLHFSSAHGRQINVTISVLAQALRILCIRAVVLTDTDNQIFTIAVPFAISKPKVIAAYARDCGLRPGHVSPPCVLYDLAP